MDLLPASIAALQTFREALDKAYGPAAQASAELQVGSHGSLAEILAFARGAA
jgi:CRISPR system Cascade subunit CasC